MDPPNLNLLTKHIVYEKIWDSFTIICVEKKQNTNCHKWFANLNSLIPLFRKRTVGRRRRCWRESFALFWEFPPLYFSNTNIERKL